MDTMVIVVVLISIVAAVAGFWFVSRRGPRPLVLIMGLGLWGLGWMIRNETGREIQLLSGICQLNGVIGMLLGFMTLFRRSQPAEDPDSDEEDEDNE